MAGKFKSQTVTPLVDATARELDEPVVETSDSEPLEQPCLGVSLPEILPPPEQPVPCVAGFVGLPSASTADWVKAACLITARPGYGGRPWALTKGETVMLPREVGLALRKAKMVSF